MCHLGFRSSDLKTPGKGTRSSYTSAPYLDSFALIASRLSWVKNSGLLRQVFVMCTSTYLFENDYLTHTRTICWGQYVLK